MKGVDWSDNVASDFRIRTIIEPDSLTLAFKANRNRYTCQTQRIYQGLPYLGSQESEDTLTWNAFRSLQKARRLDIVCNNLDIGEPQGMLLWTPAAGTGGVNAELQYAVGQLM